MGNTLQNQRDNLNKYLSQWELDGQGSEPQEIHVCGDMNMENGFNPRTIFPPCQSC